MNLRTLLIALALTLLAAFALLNWAAFSSPTTLTLGLMDVQAPLGLVMLVVSALISALFLVYIVFQQAGVIIEARRYAKELKSHRELADRAEASRFTEMRAFLEAELRRLEEQNAAAMRELNARIELLQRQLHDAVAESATGLSAYLGEIDDKLDSVLPTRPPA